MSVKRPRPAIPVLVHVDNPAEVGSVVVDTSTIEGKMDTVITNQNRIYDKIPTSSGGGGSADLTTVNEKITTLAEAVGPANSGTGSRNLIGHVINLVGSIGDFNAASTPSGGTVKSYLSNIRNAIGNSTIDPTATESTVRGLLTAIKENTASGGGGGGADLTTVNEKITAINAAVGDGAVAANEQSLIGLAKGINASLGSMSASDAKSSSNIKGRLYNIQSSIGDALNSPSLTGTTVRDLLSQIKTTTGDITSSSEANNLFGFVKNISSTVGDCNTTITANASHLRSILYNIRQAVGSSTSTPTATETTVRGLLTAIKENTASGGGGGGSADLTTVNEKTTALAAAIGSASDDSSTVSVIGLLKSITDKY